MARLQFHHTLKRRRLAGHVAEAKKLLHVLAIQGLRNTPGMKCLNFRCKIEASVMYGIIQRLDAYAVPGYKKTFILIIPDRKCEHAVQFVQHGWAELDIQFQQYLRIGM